MNTELKVLPITSIVESKTNPRRHFDDKTLKELAESIKAKGILNPLLVRPVNGHYEIVAGARRFRASRAAQISEVPAFIRQLSDQEALEIQVIENLQREDVHPLDEAEGYDQLMKKSGYHVETIATKVGKSASYVYQRLKLAGLIEPAKKAFWDGQLTPSHAILIARLQPNDQQRALTFALKSWHGFEGSHEYHNELNPDPSEEKRIAQEYGKAQTVSSVRDLADFIQKRILLDLRDAAFDKGDEKLLSKAGSCLSCPKRSGFNKELFNDITKSPDTCTDPVCFAAKQQAHVDRLKESLKKEKKRFIEITQDRRKPEGHEGAITERSFKKVSGKPCKHARVGIYIDGANKGHIITICAAKKECKQHWAEYQKERRARQSGGAERQRIDYEEERRQREAKVKRAEKRFRPIVQEIWRHLPNQLPKGWESALAKILLEDVPSDVVDNRPKDVKLTSIQAINLALLCEEFRIDVSWEGTIHPDLFKATKRLGIKFEPILQKISDDEKAQAKAEKEKAGKAKVQTSAKKATGRKGGKRR